MASLKTADDFYGQKGQWQEELSALRDIILECGLTESIKWGIPVYTHNGKNVVGVARFKSYFGLWFFQGALLVDNKSLLVSGSEGQTKAQRQLRMYEQKDINKKIIVAYVKESLMHFDSGLEIKAEKNKTLSIPPLLEAQFKQNKSLKAAFEKLNLTRKREFAEYIEMAKQVETKQKRLQKIIPLILEGKGLHDQYK